MYIKIISFIAFAIALTIGLFLTFQLTTNNNRELAITPSTWWDIQSIDTMKYSRDLTREKMYDASFSEQIELQIKNIANTGATHVGIATPYDEQFIPMLRRWVTAARKYNLKIWYRGNFAGWEGWFDTPRITRAQHLQKTIDFIKSNGDLFAQGDIFTPCPECENGGPGDPRLNGDTLGHRQFLIDLFRVSTDTFRLIGKGVQVGYFSMNYDVAKLIMDPQTTEQLGGVVTIDHYIKTPQELDYDITAIAQSSQGKVYLGEFGAPIPDIHGQMSEEAQHDWIAQALSLIAKNPNVVGVNYWVNIGGSTQLWSADHKARKAVLALRSYYAPKHITATIVDQLNRPIKDTTIQTMYKKTKTNTLGQFILPILGKETDIFVEVENKANETVHIQDLQANQKIIIQKPLLNPIEKLLAYLYNLFQ